MAYRVYNFNAGPATLPLEVLEIVQNELLDYRGTGMSIIESTHRSLEYDEINDTCIALFKELFNLSDGYHVLFLGGGASSQFAIVPMNFLTKDKTGAYIDTGTWSSKAMKEAKLFGNVHVVASSKESNYDHIPTDFDIPSDAAYLHMTSNNTIFGTQFQSIPDSKGIPLVCDMSSDIGSRVHDFNKFDIIFAGAQKNLGPAGVTVVIISDKMLASCNENVTTMFSYKTHAEKKSLFNTPPVFGVYVMKLVLEWIKKQGGLPEIEKINFAKKERIYQLMDLNPQYFRGTVQPESRSWMNITMRLPNEELEKKCIAEAKAAGFSGLKGHRSVGGIRISTYNAMPKEGIEKLAEFLEKFRFNNPD